MIPKMVILQEQILWENIKKQQIVTTKGFLT